MPPETKRKQKFEDQVVTEISISVTGKIVTNLGTTLLHVGDEVNFLGTAIVKEVSHKGAEVGVSRVQKTKLGEIHLLIGTDGIDLLAELRDRDKRAMDELLGRAQLPFDGNPDGPPPGDDDRPVE